MATYKKQRINTEGEFRRGLRETKNFDIASTTRAAVVAGTVELLNAIPQGLSDNERIGKDIRLKTLHIKGATIGQSTGYRSVYLIVSDIMPTGVLPAVDDILDAETSFGNQVYAQNNSYNTSRFKILKRITTPSKDAVGGDTSYSESMDTFLDLKDILTQYKDLGTGAIDDIATGALYLVYLTSRPTSSVDSHMSMRIRYLD